MASSGYAKMRHALGVARYSLGGGKSRWSKPYRNHFVAGDDDIAAWDALVSAGYAERLGRDALSGSMPTYRVTGPGRIVATKGILFKRRWGYGEPVHP